MNKQDLERISIFKDTQKWIKENHCLTKAVSFSKQHTKIYYDNDYPLLQLTDSVEDQSVFVTKERSFAAAIQLRKKYPDKRIAVLNFANAFIPGGGVTIGSSAQEESLCRTSTLYPLLNCRRIKREFYSYNRHCNTPKGTDTLVYSENVIICKSDELCPKRLAQEDWVTVDIMTIAAPDLRKSPNRFMFLLGNGESMTDAELFGYHVKRAIHILTVAASKEIDLLILGAFGCGAFENNPEIVAKAYKVAINEFPKCFDEIRFAVYCSSSDNYNYDVFNRVLGS